MRAVLLLGVAASLAAVGTSPTSGRDKGPPVEDYTDARPQDHGVEPVKPKKDPKTGFVVGGTNPTSLIQGLAELNGRSIAALEKAMRPGASSDAGFLGTGEKLLDVLAADNRYVVEERGLTHQELARHLHLVPAVAIRLERAGREKPEFRYHGRRYRVELRAYRGYQDSPFRDGTKTNTEATVHNLDNGKKLEYSLLVPHLIERYGFYEGKGTKYRVEPREVLAVFDFLKKPKTKQ